MANSPSFLAHLLAKLVLKNQPPWIALGNLESRILQEKIAATPIEKPVFITGMARSGTTIALESLATHPDVVTHCYRDFPMLFTPYVWNRMLHMLDRFMPGETPSERAHKDALMVTSQSPEAMEEILWMAFFQQLHDPHYSSILDADTENEAFETFYTEHIKKLLLAKRRHRYLTKANYDVTRLSYLLKLFPDAKFIVMVRHPVNHIASCIKQDKLFKQTHQQSPRSLEYMHMSGHFEFGEGKVPVSIDLEKNRQIQQRFEEGNDVQAWALQWQAIYRYLADLIEKKDIPTKNIFVCQYENLCKEPEENLEKLYAFANLATTHEHIKAQSSIIAEHTPRPVDLSNNDIRKILDQCTDLIEYYGYNKNTFTESI